MKLKISAELNYTLLQPVDLMLHLEAAAIPEQTILESDLDVGDCEYVAQVPGEDNIGQRVWLRTRDQLQVSYLALVEPNRDTTDYRTLEQVPFHQLPGPTVAYLNESRYCHSLRFTDFVNTRFSNLSGGHKIGAMRDWIFETFTYTPGVSDASTTASDTFEARRGVCRDYAHVLIALSRAAGIPARIASVYATGIEPQDFHAVAEVFVGGVWHLVDATGMAKEAEMVKIGIGRDAADVSFLTAYGPVQLVSQSVNVTKV